MYYAQLPLLRWQHVIFFRTLTQCYVENSAIKNNWCTLVLEYLQLLYKMLYQSQQHIASFNSSNLQFNNHMVFVLNVNSLLCLILCQSTQDCLLIRIFNPPITSTLKVKLTKTIKYSIKLNDLIYFCVYIFCIFSLHTIPFFSS